MNHMPFEKSNVGAEAKATARSSLKMNKLIMNANDHFRIRFFQLLLLVLLAAMPARANIMVQDYWRMGENDPAASSGGSCTNLLDAVGGLTLTNTPSLSTYPGYTNDVAATAAATTGSQLAMQMNGGQSSVGNVISELTNNFGIELWVKPANTAAGTKLLAYNGNTSYSGWGLFQNGAAYEVVYGGIAIFGSAPASSNVWMHLALVQASGTATLYTNGVAAGSYAVTPNSPAGNFLIGVNNLGGEHFAGVLDEVRVFTFFPGEFQVNDLLYFQAPAFSLSSSNFNEGASAGSDIVNLSVAPTNVSWTAKANVSWLHVTNASTHGTGGATIGFTFDGNPGGTRAGTLTIAGIGVGVTQGQASYSLDGNYDYYWTGDYVEEPATAGSDSVGLTVTPNVGTWSVSPTVDWIHPTNPSGQGSTNISFTFDANTDPTGAARYGQVYINNPANPLLRFLVFQQAPPSGTGQATYHFTGQLIAYLPEYTPTNASAALQSVQNNDIFYLTMTLVPSSAPLYYETWACAVNNIIFEVPSRGLTYTQSFDNLDVLDDGDNPDTLRWDVPGVDSSVTMTFWARDFSQTALTSGNVPFPLNLSGFHTDGFAQISLFNAVGDNPTLFYGNLTPMPTLCLRQQQHTNTISWVTSDTFYTPTLQSACSLAPNAVWTDVTNSLLTFGLTNIVTLPATNSGAQFFRLKVL